MKIKATFGDNEVKNPVAKFLILLLALLIFLALFIVLLILALPFIWFTVLSILLVMLSVIFVAPKIIHHYKIILINRETIEHNN